MDYVFFFNAFESVLWFTIGVVLLFLSKRQPAWRGRLQISAFGFIAFGFTDLVEMQTGAWWKPWWLFVWKAACVLLLATVGIYHRRKSGESRSNPGNSRD